MTPNDNNQNKGQEKYGVCKWWCLGCLCLASSMRTFIICLTVVILRSTLHPSASSFYFIFILWLVFISIQINPHTHSLPLSRSLVFIIFFFSGRRSCFAKPFVFSCLTRCRSCSLASHFIRHRAHFMKNGPTTMTKTNNFENGQLSLSIYA